MQSKHSRPLGDIISRFAFDTERDNLTDWLLDRLFLRVLSSAGCRAERILSSLLKDWEIHRAKSRISREVDTLPEPQAPARGEFFATLSSRLEQVAGVDAVLDTAHVLRLAVSDVSTISSRVLAMYGIDREDVEIKMLEIEPNEDLHPNYIASERRVIPITIAAAQERSTLEQYSTDLTAAALQGRLDVVVGREAEIERLIQILGRRKKNNPVLVGQAGVGKSAIVEGLALRIVAGEVPQRLRDKRILSLDVSALVAGTKYRGEFEERINRIIEELRSNRSIIVFIDEIHTIVGAGSTQGSLDTANILKPALARGELQCVGATTLDEYRENIERDAALERRFQKILVEPATAEQTLQILHNIKPFYERHHSVRYSDEALRACVALSERYILDRHFPDKAIDVMDEVGAKMQYASDERVVGVHHIEQMITSITGIPVERISQSERCRLSSMAEELERNVVGQSEAVAKVVGSIVRSRAGLKDPSKPIGVFMFVGPSGVGKTHLAEELARVMFDRDDALIRIDMSEYGEPHNVSRLIGSPPGYVGYGEGGRLTEAVRRQPYAVVLFDEIEKAHSDVFNLMLQLLDDGVLTDGMGRKVDFKNTIIIMTSNAGSREVVSRARGVGYRTSSQAAQQDVAVDSNYRKALTEIFAPEFINRIDDVVIFATLSIEHIERIVDLEFERLCRRAEQLGYRMELSAVARRRLAEQGYNSTYGVRSLKREILRWVEEPLARMIVSGEVSLGDTIDVEWRSEEFRLMVRKAA